MRVHPPLSERSCPQSRVLIGCLPLSAHCATSAGHAAAGCGRQFLTASSHTLRTVISASSHSLGTAVSAHRVIQRAASTDTCLQPQLTVQQLEEADEFLTASSHSSNTPET
mmetsp:Transcript_14875/g.40089  ORF Transcript_14875/g.40089 Transcript_14875/m.40089 type:complete len:111 (-) Transcript_14875:364-696(-)